MKNGIRRFIFRKQYFQFWKTRGANEVTENLLQNTSVVTKNFNK